MSEIEFSQAVQGLRPLLLGFTWRFTADREAALDLVQDTIYKALRYREKYRKDSNLRGWLFTIMRNTFFNQHARARRWQPIDTVPDVEDHHTSRLPDKSLEYTEMMEIVKTIAPHISTPFMLYVEGYPYEEISKRLNIPLGTVKNRIFQCRQQLKKKLAENY